MTFSETKTYFIRPLVNYIFRLTLALVILSTIIWLYFILLGSFHLGHFPKYGDPELISFDGIDRKALILSTLITIYGVLIIMICNLANLILRLRAISKKLIFISIAVVILNFIIIYSSAFEWALD